MRPRTLVFITMLALCHLQLQGQMLTNALPPAGQGHAAGSGPSDQNPEVQVALPSSLPDDPGQEILPVAQPEPAPATGVPVQIEAAEQTLVGNVWTLIGNVTIHYKSYVIHADKIIYNRATTDLKADGHVHVTDGPEGTVINASHGEMRLNAHTARFYDVQGSHGVAALGHSIVFATTNPFLFTGRVVLETGEGRYRIIDGSMTNCHLPKPDWRIIAHTISMENGEASTSNAFFEFLRIPIFYLPYLRHPVNTNGRQSGLLIPVLSNSSIEGYVFGEQVYWAINRSMDMVVGTEYFSKRGWAPNGDFRYKGQGLDHLTVRWNALFDRGITQTVSTASPPSGSSQSPSQGSGSVVTERVNQGGTDVSAFGRRDFSSETRISGIAEYLSSYVYRLIFDDNYAQATSSQVSSDVAFTHAHRGLIPSASLERFETFASTVNGDEVRLLHLPNLRYDILDRPLRSSRVYWGMGSSLNYLSRSEPGFHARNVGRFDFYPHLSIPLVGGGWSMVAGGALRDTSYTISQHPDLTGANNGIPTISHDALHRGDIEASLDIRPPAMERDFVLPFGKQVLRHVIEPEFNYRFVGGIGPQARNVLLFDTADIATNTSEGGYSLTQRLYLRPGGGRSCGQKDTKAAGGCAAMPREWASWQVAQEFFMDPTFGGALIPNRRNIFNSTLDLTGVAFLTSPRNISPLISRLRFEAINNLRIEWDFDYDPKMGQFNADNLYAGYTVGRTTVGVVRAMLNAPDEPVSPNSPTLGTLKSQLLQPFLEIGKPNGKGLNLAFNGSYDFVQSVLQYAGVQAVYNWDCCGLTLGYRRFELGTVGAVNPNYHEFLYSFTLANFGNIGDIRRWNSVFHDPRQPPVY